MVSEDGLGRWGETKGVLDYRKSHHRLSRVGMVMPRRKLTD